MKPNIKLSHSSNVTIISAFIVRASAGVVGFSAYRTRGSLGNSKKTKQDLNDRREQQQIVLIRHPSYSIHDVPKPVPNSAAPPHPSPAFPPKHLEKGEFRCHKICFA